MENLEVKNQHQQVIHYLMNIRNFTLADVINDSMFHKFQTRLSEIEAEHGVIAKREKVNFINKFGNSGTYYKYSSLKTREELIELLNKYRAK